MAQVGEQARPTNPLHSRGQPPFRTRIGHGRTVEPRRTVGSPQMKSGRSKTRSNASSHTNVATPVHEDKTAVAV
jgi:hypothetical protein